MSRNKLTTEDFNKAKEALEKAQVHPPYVAIVSPQEETQNLLRLMEEMANVPREGMGKRSPGEKGAYERRLGENDSKVPQSDLKGPGLPL